MIDVAMLGRRLRVLRILRGFDRMSDFTGVLSSQYGLELSDRTVYAVERGEQMPHVDFFLAAMCLLDSEPGYWAPAMRQDCVEHMKRIYGG